MVLDCLPKSIQQRPDSYPHLSASGQGHSQLYNHGLEQPGDKPPCQAWRHQGMMFQLLLLSMWLYSEHIQFSRILLY